VTKRLTDLAVKKLKPGPVRREIADPGCTGLYCVLQPSGHRSFAVRFRFQGRPKKLTLGTIPLAAARKAAAIALHEATEGRDPTAAKRQAKAERRIVEGNTFAAVAEQYQKLAGNKLRSANRQAADLRRLVYPALGHRPITEIRRSEIVALLDEVEIESGPVAADRTLAIIRRIMNWHASRADNFAPPIVKGMARTSPKQRQRSRILSDAEITAVWNTASKQAGPFAALVRFLLLVGARRNEAAGATWSEIEGDVWRLPAVRNKSKTELARPLSRAALAVLESQRREGCPFVFGNVSGSAPINVFGRAKVAFDKASRTAGWTLHDLRRTARSLMSRAGIDADIGERCLGHALAGVRGTYDRHTYLPEMKRAYDALAALIERIANPPKDNVTPLKKKQA
jgi:integrase